MKSARFVCFSFLILLFSFSTLTYAGVPQMINYQGKITTPAGALVDTTISMTFAIYTDSIGTDSVWSETQSSVVVQKGVFSVLLGSVNLIPDSVFDGSVRYLGVKVGSDPEMSPRKAIVSVAYAMRAGTVEGTTGGTIHGDVALVDSLADTTFSIVDGNVHAQGDIKSGSSLILKGNQHELVSTIGEMYLGREGGDFGDVKVGIGTTSPDEELHVVGNIKMVDGNQAAGKVLTSDANGVGTWQTGTGGGTDNDWTFRITDTADSTLMTGGEWGISRFGNVLWGNADSTHVNLGVACTTGADGQNYKYCTVGGGKSNAASSVNATVGGGRENTASGGSATVGGGIWNTASNNYSAVGGGLRNKATGQGATVGGGGYNFVSGDMATVPGGWHDSVSGEYSMAAGREVTIAPEGDYTFAFGRDFRTSTPNAVIFHNTWDPIKVGVGTTAPDEELHIVGNIKMVDGNQAAGKVLTSDANGVGTWQNAGGSNNDWTFRITDTADTTLMTGGAWGISRYGNILYGNADSTHVNLGVACTTGNSGSNLKYSAVAGGLGNKASGSAATVAGGERNSASANRSTVAGGSGNTASANNATIGGGYNNTAIGIYSTVGGGYADTASGRYATVGGGYKNVARLDYAIVGGGYENDARKNYATIGGGWHNWAEGDYATVGGGSGNGAGSLYSTVGGGRNNYTWDEYATVGGGYANEVYGHSAIVGGGRLNVAVDRCATVGGGESDTARGEWATIGGGAYNITESDYSTVSGGFQNTASNYGATVVGGYRNTAAGQLSMAAGQNVTITTNAYNTFAFGNDFTTSTPRAAIFYNSGIPIKVGIQTTAPDEELHVVGNIKMVDGSQGAGKVLTSDANGRGTWQTPASDGIGGSGITNFITKFTSSNTVGNSVMYESLNKIGIGITTPDVNLHVVGGTDAEITGGGYVVTGHVNAKNIAIDDNEIMARDNGAASALHINNGSGDVYMCNNGGDVGIGEGSPTAKLHVTSIGDYAMKAVTGGNTALFAKGAEVGGYFRDDGDQCYAALPGGGGEGIRTQGAHVGGVFSNELYSGYGEIARHNDGMRGYGPYSGGYFEDTDEGTYGWVARGAYKVLSIGTNSFMQNHPSDKDRVIVYSAPEGDEVATYTRGSARLVNGEARVTLGETFKWVTNPDIGLTAHITPRGDCNGMYVASLSTSEIVVKELAGGKSNAAFDYIVYGLRIGFEELSVVTEKERESYIPSMASFRELYQRQPDLRKFTALERFKLMNAEMGRPEPDMSASKKLKDAIIEFDPKIHKSPSEGRL